VKTIGADTGVGGDRPHAAGRVLDDGAHNPPVRPVQERGEADADALRTRYTVRQPAATTELLPNAELSAPATPRPYAGTYETPSGARFEVVLKDGGLGIVFPGQPFQALVPWQPRRFRVKEFADLWFEFVVTDSRVTALEPIDPSGERTLPRR
jgi:hypothetical protein